MPSLYFSFVTPLGETFVRERTLSVLTERGCPDTALGICRGTPLFIDAADAPKNKVVALGYLRLITDGGRVGDPYRAVCKCPNKTVIAFRGIGSADAHPEERVPTARGVVQASVRQRWHL